MKKILLVEDDSSLGDSLKTKLSQTYDVTWARNVRSAKEAVSSGHWDVVILDIGLPDGNGFDVVQAIQGLKVKPPFIFLTAQSDAETRLKGYELGGEEFVPKPFHLKELLLRIEHVIDQHPTLDFIELKSARIDLTNHSIQKHGGGIEYPSMTDMKILKFLIARSPRPVSRDEIMDEVWGKDKEASHRTIDNAIVRLRGFLGSSGELCLKSVRSLGYQWIHESDLDKLEQE